MGVSSSLERERATYPLGVVVRLTGLSADVIRVWERRYSVVSPDRTGSRRRLYSEPRGKGLVPARIAKAFAPFDLRQSILAGG